MLFIGKMPGACIVGVVPHAVQELLSCAAPLTKPDLVVVADTKLAASFFQQGDIIEAYPVSLGVDMQLADGHGLPSCLREGLCHGGRLRHLHRVAVDAVPM